MIDPKLNKLPVPEDVEEKVKGSSSEQESTGRTRRRGLGINETVAANANMSVGGRGVEVSGVSAGSGAGAGATLSTPAAPGESPAPKIVPGSSSTGTTPRGQVAPDQNPSLRLDERPTNEEIAARAYKCWQERGCPQGSHEEDWRRAEEELCAERRSRRATAASV